MTNAWSMLFDVMEEQKQKDQFEMYGDTYLPSVPSLYGTGADYTDPMSPDTITFNQPKREVVITTMDNKNENFWKYNEGNILKDLENYLIGTYQGHYTSEGSNVQTLDLIEAIGDAEGFCRSNAIKYLSRFGKKNGKNKLDILKAMHYTILLYHFSGLDTVAGSDNVDTNSPLGY